MPEAKRPPGRPRVYGDHPKEPSILEAAESGHRATLLECREILSRRLAGRVPAREVAALVSVAQLVEKELAKLDERRPF